MQFSRCPLLCFTVRVLFLVVTIHWTEHPSLIGSANLSSNDVCIWLSHIFGVAITFFIRIVYIYGQIIYSQCFCNFSDNFLYYQVIYVYFVKKYLQENILKMISNHLKGSSAISILCHIQKLWTSYPCEQPSLQVPLG